MAYLGVLFTTYAASRRKAKSHWQLNRSAAEFIKSMCWRYAVHGSPFDTGTQHPEAVFANRLEEGLQELRKVGWVDPRDEMSDAGGGLITESMRELRSRAFTVRKETYVRDRLIEQRRWYRRRQHVSRRGALVWSSAIAALTTPALALSLLQTFGAARSFALTGALSAAAAACLAWNEMRRHHPLISAHSLVEKDLESMQAAMETSLTERQWPVAVFETERIVSRNTPTGWPGIACELTADQARSTPSRQITVTGRPSVRAYVTMSPVPPKPRAGRPSQTASSRSQWSAM